ncbi:MAG: hypothetical protein AAGL96_12770 [Pseudomonadota bacterium]
MAETERSWVWVASTASAQAGKLSVLACVETVAMVAIYWAIALIWDTHVHLLAGLLVMPLMLFRSDESVALGLRWATTTPEQGDLLELLLVLSGILTVSLVFAQIFLPFSFAFGVAGCVAVLLFVFSLHLWAPWARNLDLRRNRPLWQTLSLWTLGFFGVPLVCLVFSVTVFLYPAAVRVLSCVVFLRKGILQAPRNWRRFVLSTDLAVVPSLIPDPRDEAPDWSFQQFELRMREAWAAAREKDLFTGIFMASLGLFVLGPAFLATILFRWALKSTAWFYLPLLFLTKPFDGGDRIIWMRSFPRTGWTLVRLVLAIVGIGVALAALVVDLPAALRALQLGRALELPVLPLSLLLVLDWSALRPWHYVSLPTALLTVTMFFRLDHLHRREQAGAKIAEDGWALRSMVWADRARSALAIVWLILITPPTLRFFHCAGQLPAWPARQLARLFGPEACVVPLAF